MQRKMYEALEYVRSGAYRFVGQGKPELIDTIQRARSDGYIKTIAHGPSASLVLTEKANRFMLKYEAETEGMV